MSKLSAALKRHGLALTAMLGASVVAVGAAKWIDRRLAQWPARRARIARTAQAGRRPAAGERDTHLRNETVKSLSASTRYCYERRVTLWLQRSLLPQAIMPSFYLEPIATAAMAARPRPRVLALGCRDELELVRLGRAMPAAVIVGLDLFSWHRRIVRGDMHALPFRSGAFDVVVASHSLEHAWDVELAAAEMLRVAAAGGVLAIEVPVKQIDRAAPLRQSAGAADRWDFSNLSVLRGTIAAVSSRPLQDLFGRDSSPRARSVQWVARVGEP